MSKTAREPARHVEPAPLDSDWGCAISSLMTAAQLAHEMDEKMLKSQILGEVRRILRRGEPE